MTLSERAEQFHLLHREGLLLLANAWDPGSARLAQHLGARAVATSSAAVAWSLGYPDGDLLPVALLPRTVEAIARVLHVPLSVDFEGGYSSDPEAVAQTAEAVIGAGAVGINIEDGSGTPELLCRKIEAVRRVAAARGVRLFINARTDVYLRGLAPAAERVAEALRRGALYRDAGADGLFVPGVVDAQEIARLAQGSPLPLNVMARATLPDAATLRRLGVRRLSAGASIAEACYGDMARRMRSFLETGASAAVVGDGAMGYAELNRLMAD
ncbi:MAG TPA: isocitrate lyase/phosphoenolpyruvate mutase family protein [Albitalea sp.]|nr:isocitrate lyase/phosphoenolpyruvate mutase family protein [Albitalea sp.]